MQELPDLDELPRDDINRMTALMLVSTLDPEHAESPRLVEVATVLGTAGLKLATSNDILFEAILLHGSSKDMAFFSLVAGARRLVWSALADTGWATPAACRDGEAESLDYHRKLREAGCHNFLRSRLH